MARRAQAIDLATCRPDDVRPLKVVDRRAENPDVGIRLGYLDKSVHEVGRYLRVVVEQQDILHATVHQARHALVDSAGEASVELVLDEGDVWELRTNSSHGTV